MKEMDYLCLCFFVLLTIASSKENLIDIGSVDKHSCTVDKEMEVVFAGVKVLCSDSYILAGFDEKPKLVLNRANVNRIYTLAMLDPDAPSREKPSQRSWLHWLVVNIKDADVSTGYEVVEYNKPTPPSGSGLHRYIFLLLEQPEEETHFLPYDKRGKFDINKYASEHSLINIAGLSFFKTEKKK